MVLKNDVTDLAKHFARGALENRVFGTLAVYLQKIYYTGRVIPNDSGQGNTRDVLERLIADIVCGDPMLATIPHVNVHHYVSAICYSLV